MTHFLIVRNKKRQGGFVLIATLLIVCLLTILVVAAVVIEQVELEAAYNSSRTEVARQNALFGLSQALNQLQMSAGPDRRVTARADILNSVNAGSGEGYQGTTPGTDGGQSFWTGVWRTTSNDFSGCAGNGLTTTNPDPAVAKNPGPDGSFFYFDYTADGNPNTTPATATLSASTPPSRAQLYDKNNVNWLISWPYSSALPNGPDPTASLTAQLPPLTIPTRTGTLSLGGSDCLVSLANKLNITTTANPNLGTSGNTSLSAPKVPILETAPGGKQIGVGTYAYWVSDEGIKAKTNIPDPFVGSAPGSTGTPSGSSKSQAHFTIAQSNDCSEALKLNGFITTAADLRSQSFLAPSLPSMAFADSTQTWEDFAKNPNTYSPDFTVSSYGLLADNFNGGLRQDMTAALEDNQVFQYHFSNGTGNEDARKLYGLNAIYQSSLVPDIENKAWSATSQGLVMDGMRWSSLFYYYNIYHTNMPSPVTTSSGANPNKGIGSQFASECSGISPTITARIYVEQNPGLGGGSVQIDGLYPDLIYWRHTYGLDLNCTKGDDTTGYDYDLIASASPLTVFYNPYDVGIQTPPSSYTSFQGQFSYTASSAPTTIAVDDVHGVPVWGPFPINMPNVTYNTEVDTRPFTAGESRAYYLNSNWNSKTPMLAAVTSPTFSSTVANMPSGVATFSTPSTLAPGMTPATAGNCLVPIGFPTYYFSSSRDQQQELTNISPGIHLPGPSGDLPKCALVASGGQRILPENLGLTRYNYVQWPYNSGTGLADLFSGPSFMGGSGTENLATAQDNSSIDPVAKRDLNFPSPANYIMSIEYHAPGTASNKFAYQGTGYEWTAQNISPTVPVGLPGLAAGGAAFNPLCADYNGYAADWSSTGKVTRYDPSTDLAESEFNNTVNGTGMSDSGWLPDSAGKEKINRQVIVHDVPRGPLLSLGQFKNMSCRYYGTGLSATAAMSASSYCPQLGFSNYPVGGSYPSGLNSTCALQLQIQVIYPATGVSYSPTPGAGSYAPYGMPINSVMQDDNFMANSVLFDGYFLSTVPPLNVSDGANWPIDTTQFNSVVRGQAYLDTNRPLPNSRLVYYRRPQSSMSPSGGNPPSTGTESPNIADLQCTNVRTANLRKPAANLLINGAFNVNSTSSTAWTALLTSTAASNSNVMALLNPQSNGTLTSVASHTFSKTEAPFLNFNLALGSAAWTGSANNNVGLFGMVDLSTATVQLLASRIVTQVQMRGPFLSLGDFLNHRLRPIPLSAQAVPNRGANQDAYSVSGALQYAIDGWPSMTWPPSNYAPAAGINASLAADPGVGMATSTALGPPSNNGYIYYFHSSKPLVPAACNRGILPDAPCQTGVGVPGTLLQQDLVQAIAPVIADRLDTFTIRVYGQALSPNGNSEAEVYGEAVVQRLPEYVYSSENGTYDANGLTNYAYDNPSQSTLNAMPNGLSISGLAKSNSALGRRFKIIAFRWLNKNEI